MKFWMLTAVVALVSTACTKYDEVDVASQGEGRVVTFTTDEIGGRTAFGESTDNGATYPTLWKDGDQVKISVGEDKLGVEKSTRTMLKDPETGVSPAVTALNGGKYASFTVAVPEEVAAPYNFFAMSPAKIWDSGKDRDGGLLRVEIPATQTATATSCDPMAQLVLATATTEEVPESLPLHFEHVAAYGLFSLTGLAAGETVTEVVLTSSKVISGRIFFDTTKEGDERIDITTSSTGLSKKITVTTSSKDVWFAALPVDLSNTTLKVEVSTNKAVYTKSIALGADRKLQSGRIAKMAISLSDATAVPREDVMVGDVWYEAGNPVGVVYWVSDDGNTVKVMHMKRSEPMVWNNPMTLTTVTTNPEMEVSHTNTDALKVWAAANPSVSFPALDYLAKLNESSDGWYWPTRRDLEAIVCLYYGVSAVSAISKVTKNDLKNSTDPALNAQYAATVAYENFLQSVGADPLDDAAETANGTTYWTSCDYRAEQAWYCRFGKYNLTAGKKSSTYCIRAVKTITNVKGRKIEEELRAASWSSQTLREGVKVHSASLSLFGRPQQIYVTEITPSAANQIGIYHAGADTPKQVATQAVSAGALAAVNGGFFPMAGATPKTGFVKINGVVKEQGDDDLNSTFAGGALVINGTTPGIVKVAGNEAARELPDENVLVCGPLLLLDGNKTTLSASSDHTTSFAQRTVVGVTENGTFLMVTIHGRATPITGMSGLELQKLMAGLRAKDALNLDGGGSTALWANGSYIYSTTRSVANIVYVK